MNVNPQLRAECLAVVTGIYPEGPPSKLQLHVAEPARLLGKFRARIKEFLGANKPEPFKRDELPDQHTTYDKITDLIDPEEMDAILVDIPVEVALPYALTLQAAREKVKASWPVYPDNSLGLRNFELAKDEFMDVLDVMRTLDTVETIFDDLDALVLLPEQVALVDEFFPDLYREIGLMCFDELQPFAEVPGIVEKKRDLSPEREEQIRVLMQLPTDAPLAPPKEQPQPQQSGRAPEAKSGKAEPEKLQTPTEHTEQRRISK